MFSYMLTQPTTILVNSPAPPPQARLPSDKGIAQKRTEEVRVAKQPDLSSMTEVVAHVQQNLNMMHKVDLEFTVHKASGRIMVTVMEASTGEVIREIPPSETLNLAAKLREMVGLIFDQKG